MNFMDKIVSTTAETIRKAQINTVEAMSSAQKEDAELRSIKTDIAAIDGELNAAYIQIGKKYFEYYLKSKTPLESIGADDFIELAEQKSARKAELAENMCKIEKRLKDQVLLQEKAKLQADTDERIEKLRSAKEMGVLTENEYKEKVLRLKKRLDNFGAIRNIEKQFEMGIITLSEKNEKLSELM